MQLTSEVKKYRFDFLKSRYMWLGLSVVYLVVGIVAYIALGGFEYHINFTGGAEVRLSFEKQLDISKLRAAVSGAGWKDAIIQETGSTQRDFALRIGGNPDAKLEQNVITVVKDAIPENKVTITGVSQVGAEVRSETTWNATVAIILAMLVLLLYIAARYEFRFGLGAFASLIHDILAILTFLVLTREQFSLDVLAAILAVLGYSVHDSIVVFSRIRENFKALKNMSEYDIVNLSINQTLRRTLLTSFSTLLSALALFLLGGETLRGFSLIMIVGIIVGTYSSIYIASPVMLAVKTKKGGE